MLVRHAIPYSVYDVMQVFSVVVVFSVPLLRTQAPGSHVLRTNRSMFSLCCVRQGERSARVLLRANSHRALSQALATTAYGPGPSHQVWQHSVVTWQMQNLQSGVHMGTM